MDCPKSMQKSHEYVKALEEEQKKIQVFQRELPLCLEIVTQAVEACREELSGTTTSEQCSEQTTGVCGAPVFEEFIPIKKGSLNEEEEEEEEEHESSPELEPNGNNKSDWLRDVQLWNNPTPDLNPNEEHVAKKAKVVEVEPKGCAFQPFQKEEKLVLEPAVKVASSWRVCGTESDLDKVGEEQIQIQQQSQSQTQMHRKQRLRWWPELHRRFLNSLQQLGGCELATPKQIRDHMKVDGLRIGQVKSHLQNYRRQTRTPALAVRTQGNANSQQPKYVLVGGIWVQSPQDFSPPSDVANNGGVSAPVVVAESPKRSVERSCNSPGVSSSTDTATTPVSSE